MLGLQGMLLLRVTDGVGSVEDQKQGKSREYKKIRLWVENIVQKDTQRVLCRETGSQAIEANK